MGDIALGRGVSVQIDVGDVMIVVASYGTAHIPAIQGVERDVEGGATIRAPVAVEVFWSRNASTCILIVSDDVADGILRASYTCVGAVAPSTLCLGNLVAQAILHILGGALPLVVDVEVGGEGGLQTRITHRDVEGVGVIVDVEELGDGRLLCLSTQGHLQVALLGEAVAQVERGRIVGDGTNGIDRTSQILLDVA